MEAKTHVLEINLISAQGLMEPSFINHHRHMKTYAVAWVDSSTKLRTRIDRIGGENPTWNDKFLFKVSPHFLSGKTSAVSVEIYAVGGIFRDKLIGSVRILISNFLPTASSAAMKSPSFAAFLIRSPSGEFFGTLNVGAMVLDSFTGLQALSKVSAIDYHDLTGENLENKHHHLIKTNKSKARVRDIMDYNYIPSNSGFQSESADLSLKVKVEYDHEAVTLEKETLFEEEEKEVVHVFEEEEKEVVHEIAEEVISDNEGSLLKLQKDVKMTMEENKKLKELVEIFMVETKGQSTVISDLSGRVKNLERKLSRRNKQRKPHYG